MYLYRKKLALFSVKYLCRVDEVVQWFVTLLQFNRLSRVRNHILLRLLDPTKFGLFASGGKLVLLRLEPKPLSACILNSHHEGILKSFCMRVVVVGKKTSIASMDECLRR